MYCQADDLCVNTAELVFMANPHDKECGIVGICGTCLEKGKERACLVCWFFGMLSPSGSNVSVGVASNIVTQPGNDPSEISVWCVAMVCGNSMENPLNLG